MTFAEAFILFTVEVSRASGDAGIPPAAIELASLARPFLAETVPSTFGPSGLPGLIRVGYSTIHDARQLGARARPWLRCIARHEVSHRALGHRPHVPSDLPPQEEEVAVYMLTRWGERDRHCDVHLRRRRF